MREWQNGDRSGRGLMFSRDDRCCRPVHRRWPFEQRSPVVETVQQTVIVVIASAFRAAFHNMPEKKVPVTGTSEIFRGSLYQFVEFKRPVLHNDNGEVIAV